MKKEISKFINIALSWLISEKNKSSFEIFVKGLTNGAGSSGSLDSEASTVSGDGTSTVSQETAIQRPDCSITTSKHSRSVDGFKGMESRSSKLIKAVILLSRTHTLLSYVNQCVDCNKATGLVLNEFVKIYQYSVVLNH